MLSKSVVKRENMKYRVSFFNQKDFILPNIEGLLKTANHRVIIVNKCPSILNCLSRSKKLIHFHSRKTSTRIFMLSLCKKSCSNDIQKLFFIHFYYKCRRRSNSFQKSVQHEDIYRSFVPHCSGKLNIKSV